MTNDLHFSYSCALLAVGSPPAGSVRASALAILDGTCGRASRSTALIPINVDSQNAPALLGRKDTYLSDQLSHLHGNHLFQYGGTYQRNDDIHARNDNGVTIDTSTDLPGGERWPGISD